VTKWSKQLVLGSARERPEGRQVQLLIVQQLAAASQFGLMKNVTFALLPLLLEKCDGFQVGENISGYPDYWSSIEFSES
jgi:hypothetical protein